MAVVYNEIGSLRVIQRELMKHQMDEFTSLQDMLHFAKHIHHHQARIIQEHTWQLKNELSVLEGQYNHAIALLKTNQQLYQDQLDQVMALVLDKLKALPPTHGRWLPTLYDFLLNFTYSMQMWWAEGKHAFQQWVLNKRHSHQWREVQRRIFTLQLDFDTAVSKSSAQERARLQEKKQLIEQLKPTIYGAIGEHQVAQQLTLLPDHCSVINDCQLHFDKALRYEGGYIKHVQMDHVCITAAGIFIIETKNWSQQSLENRQLRSPVQQIQRARYATQMALRQFSRRWMEHHWGKRKIPIRNLIVFTRQKPIERFEYVTLLTLSELNTYIQRFPACLHASEVERIAEYLVNQSTQHNLGSRLKMT